MKRIPTLLFTLLLIALLAAGCGLLSKKGPSIASVVLTDQVEPTSKAPVREVDSFASGARQLLVSVRVTNPQPGTKVEARWFFDREGDGSFRLVDAADVRFETAGSRHVAFSLRADSTFPDGAYRLQILLDGHLVEEKSFKVG